MDIGYTLGLLGLAGICWAGSCYFDKRQKKLAAQHCIEVTATICEYLPLEGADRKGRPVFSTVLSYRVNEQEYQVQLDDQIPAADQKPIGSSVRLLCSKQDPSECMLADFPVKKGFFGL